MKRYHFVFLILSLAVIICIFFFEGGISVIEHLLSYKSNNITIVLDAGHGGFDPGKIGVNKAFEKDINLSITLKLKKLLEENDIHVIMTREDEHGLYNVTDYDKKRADLKKRVAIINSSNALFAISIHQNSFTQEYSWGAQVFYHQNSMEGKMLAETIQERVKKTMKDGNHRLAKANSTYYLLKYTSCPLVIVECGFLSNRKEAELLLDEEYQNKIAWAIHLGILEYINNLTKVNDAPIVKN